MYTFTGSGTPVAGGIVAVRPSEEFHTGFLHAVQHEYNFSKEGYGGVYPENMTAMTLEARANSCNRDPPCVPDKCCDGEHSDLTAFCFAGAQTDQGIVFHLAVDGQQDRRVITDFPHSWASVGVWQPTLDPKPWQLHKLPEL